MKLFKNVYKGKKVLITGHTGFKGSWLTLWLVLLGAKVCGFSNNYKTHPSLFNILKLKRKIKSYNGDISKFNEISKVVKSFKPEIIFHLAAQALVKESYKDPIKTFKTNSLGTLNLLKSCEYSKRLKAVVLITSDKVYKNIEIERGYKENDIMMGKDPYSASKSCAEIIINMYLSSYLSKDKINLCITRAGNVIGGGDWSNDRIIPDIIKKWSKSKVLKIRSPLATRPWQFVLEPIGSYLYLGSILLKKNDKVNFQSFNIGPNKNMNKSVVDLIKVVKKSLKSFKFKVSKDKKIKEARLLKLNCKKINQITGWKPVYNFNKTVYDTISWYKYYYSNKSDIYNYSVNQIKNYILNAQKQKKPWITSGKN